MWLSVDCLQQFISVQVTFDAPREKTKNDAFHMVCSEPSMPLEDFVEQMCDELEVSYAKVGPAVCDKLTGPPCCTCCIGTAESLSLHTRACISGEMIFFSCPLATLSRCVK